jgi:hypothetical protein
MRVREHSLTRRPLWNRSRGRDNQCRCGNITAYHAQRVVQVLFVWDHEIRVLNGVPGQCDMLFVRPRPIGRRGRRIDTYCHPPHEHVDESLIVDLCACSGCFRLVRQGGAPGITCAAGPTHGGVVCGVRLLVEEGGVASIYLVPLSLRSIVF